MENVIQVNQTIGLDVYMNCVLVKAGLRNAMLIQPSDYKEATSNDPKTAAKLKELRKAFPELIQSDIYGETIISKHHYKNADFKSSEDMGKTLGFPCAAEFTYILEHRDEPSTSIHIEVILKPGSDTKSTNIISYACRDDRTYMEAITFAAKAEEILKADPIVGKIVDGVVARKESVMPPKFLIQKLLSNDPLSDSDQTETINCIWNLGLENASVYNYNFTNPVHRGILIGLLSVYDNNPIEPFYPLQYREEGKEVNEIIAKWDVALQGIFMQKGGSRKTRKSRKAKRNQ